ncbi:hypothetical protein FACS189432_08780 [Bacteroidia bacterium]|nr:hypothetical protein FACS189426_10850 [Bacteroidia bacterium]GHT29599.1 hypothetical protein FACS189432_08780 [Bacteroidia bacterium]
MTTNALSRRASRSSFPRKIHAGAFQRKLQKYEINLETNMVSVVEKIKTTSKNKKLLILKNKKDD